MTFPVFASGDVLNASDMNAVGLWLVKTQTIGSAVSSVQVTGAFSANYRDYLILLDGGTSSSNVDLNLSLGSTATGYYSNLVYNTYGSATVTGIAYQNQSNWYFAGSAFTNKLSAWIELHSPFETEETSYAARLVQTSTTGLSGIAQGYLNNTTSYTAFTLTSPSATMTGGVIRVYGYRT